MVALSQGAPPRRRARRGKWLAGDERKGAAHVSEQITKELVNTIDRTPMYLGGSSYDPSLHELVDMAQELCGHSTGHPVDPSLPGSCRGGISI